MVVVWVHAAERILGAVGHHDVDHQKPAQVQLGGQAQCAKDELGAPIVRRVEFLKDDLDLPFLNKMGKRGEWRWKWSSAQL